MSRPALRASHTGLATLLFAATLPLATPARGDDAAPPATAATITIQLDGRLDESAWQQAVTLDQFVLTAPFSGEPAPQATEARLLSTPQGLYIGFRNRQTADSLRSTRHSRDAEDSEADAVAIAIDFDARGRSAWFFYVSLGNSVKDGSIVNETEISYDWDGQWHAQTAVTPDGWEAEILLPWSVVPIRLSDAGTRDLRVALMRRISSTAQDVGYPAAHWDRNTFLSDLAPLSLPNQKIPAQFDVFPYLTLSQDLQGHGSDEKAGLDLVWKANGSQITATFNPDFGQVESDELVVNFSAVETFVSEKRPFFTENNTLFDLQGPEDLRIVHTRRIGAGADTGSAGASDIQYAAKATHVDLHWDAGVFTAQEDDPQDSLGRRFDVARLTHKQEQFSIGYLGTQVDRPALDRKANVDAIDFLLRPDSTLQLSGALLQSRIDEAGVNTRDQGVFSLLRYAPSQNVVHMAEYARYGRDLQLRDLGYVERVDLQRLYYAREQSITDFAADSRSQGRTVRTGFYASENIAGRSLWNGLQLEWSEQLRSAASTHLEFWIYDDGLEDQETRGNGAFRFDAGFELNAGWFGNEDGQFRTHHELAISNEGIDDYQWTLHSHPGWVFNDHLNVMWGFWYTQGREWLLWRDDHLATFAREQWNTRIELNWNLDDHNELRLAWQWLALKAHPLRRYAIVNERLIDNGAEAGGFVVGDLAVQLRYTHRFSPLSSLYVVYSRGGSEDPDQPDGRLPFRDLFQQSLEQASTETLLVKLRLHW